MIIWSVLAMNKVTQMHVKVTLAVQCRAEWVTTENGLFMVLFHGVLAVVT